MKEEANIENLFLSILKFTNKKFPDATPEEHLKKLHQETKEVLESPFDIVEYSDCLICLLAAAYRAGFTCEEVIRHAFKKLEINNQRTYIKQPDGTYQHE